MNKNRSLIENCQNIYQCNMLNTCLQKKWKQQERTHCFGSCQLSVASMATKMRRPLSLVSCFKHVVNSTPLLHHTLHKSIVQIRCQFYSHFISIVPLIGTISSSANELWVFIHVIVCWMTCLKCKKSLLAEKLQIFAIKRFNLLWQN